MFDQTQKRDAGKPRLFLVPAELDVAVGTVMTFGADKYGPNTWRGVEMERYQDALARHFAAYKADPDGVDEESGLPHLWHLATNAAFCARCTRGRRNEGAGKRCGVRTMSWAGRRRPATKWAACRKRIDRRPAFGVVERNDILVCLFCAPQARRQKRHGNRTAQGCKLKGEAYGV